jgi:hypothetical protein
MKPSERSEALCALTPQRVPCTFGARVGWVGKSQIVAQVPACE